MLSDELKRYCEECSEFEIKFYQEGEKVFAKHVLDEYGNYICLVCDGSWVVIQTKTDGEHIRINYPLYRPSVANAFNKLKEHIRLYYDGRIYCDG